MKRVIVLGLWLSLCGCAPFIGYSHLSDPSIPGDGYDLGCAGLKFDIAVDISAAWCENLNNDWAGVKVDVEYVWRE